MHDDLNGCIETAKAARDGVLSGDMTVKEANAVAGNNKIIISAHAIDLRLKIFIHETSPAALPAPAATTARRA